MTKYEIMFIVQPNLEEEALKKVVKSLEKYTNRKIVRIK